MGIVASKFDDTLGSRSGSGGVGGGKSSIKDLLLRAAASKSSGKTSRKFEGEEKDFENDYHRDGLEDDDDDDECAIDALSTLIGEDEESEEEEKEEDDADESDGGYSDETIVDNNDYSDDNFDDGDENTEVNANLHCMESESHRTANGDQSVSAPYSSNSAAAASSPPPPSPPPPSPPPPSPSPSPNSKSKDVFHAVISRWRKSKDKRLLSQNLASLQRVNSRISTESNPEKYFFSDYFQKNYGRLEEQEEESRCDEVDDAHRASTTKSFVASFAVPSTSKINSSIRVSKTKTSILPNQPFSTTETKAITTTAAGNSFIDDAFLSQIDPTVLDELPPEIRKEIHEALERRKLEKEATNRELIGKEKVTRRREIPVIRNEESVVELRGRSAMEVEGASASTSGDALKSPVKIGNDVFSLTESNHFRPRQQSSEEDLFDDDEEAGKSTSHTLPIDAASGSFSVHASRRNFVNNSVRVSDDSSRKHSIIERTSRQHGLSAEDSLQHRTSDEVSRQQQRISAEDSLQHHIPNRTSRERLLVRCEECDEMVDVVEMEEHQDFHFAADLQKEIRKNDVIQRRAQRETTTTKRTTAKNTTDSPMKKGGESGVGRGRGRGKGKKEANLTGSKNIKNFFN